MRRARRGFLLSLTFLRSLVRGTAFLTRRWRARKVRTIAKFAKGLCDIANDEIRFLAGVKCSKLVFGILHCELILP